MKNPHPPGGFVTPVPAWLIEMAKHSSTQFFNFIHTARENGYHVSNEWDAQRDIPVIYPIH